MFKQWGEWVPFDFREVESIDLRTLRSDEAALADPERGGWTILRKMNRQLQKKRGILDTLDGKRHHEFPKLEGAM